MDGWRDRLNGRLVLVLPLRVDDDEIGYDVMGCVKRGW